MNDTRSTVDAYVMGRILEEVVRSLDRVIERREKNRAGDSQSPGEAHPPGGIGSPPGGGVSQ